MIKEVNIQVLPKIAANKTLLKKIVSEKNNIRLSNITHIDIIRRSIDARQKKIKINLRISIYINENITKKNEKPVNYKDVSNKDKVIIVGAGPAGLFAALQLIQNGIKFNDRHIRCCNHH